MSVKPPSSHKQILKSSALIGGTQVVNMGIGIVRNKALAILLGPVGMGAAGLYLSTTNVIGAVAGLGLNASGVRQIAEAAGTNDEVRIARTVITLRRVSRFSGLLGMVLVLALSPLLSRSTFGDDKHVFGIAVMSLTLLCGDISAGQLALIQGLRRLRDLASSQIVGAIFGTVVSVTLVWLFRDSGIVPYLVTIAAFGILLSWWYARRVKVKRVEVTWRETFVEARGLLEMGFAFIVSALISRGTAYLTQILVQHQLGMEAVGIYAATWTLSSYYVGFVLTAMGTDFMPRLTAALNDHRTMNRLINEQTEVGVLISVPGVMATLALAPWIMKAFYSSAFVEGAEVVRWQILGIFLRVVCWPMGYILVAKGRSVMFALCELAFGVISVGMLLICMKLWKLEGVGIAFALAYLVYTGVQMGVAWRLIGFRWSATAMKILVPTFLAVAFVFCCTKFLPEGLGMGIGVAVTVLTGGVSLIALQKLLGINLLQTVRQKLQPDFRAEVKSAD